jgi:single-strand DNA-binding protein
MSANFNKVILAGNLTRDPQLSFLPSNTPVCEFGLAINHKWRGQDGEMREDTCFVDLCIYGRQAETFNQYMSKGRSVLIEGRLKFEQWEGKDGTKRSRLRVNVDRFQFLGAPRGERSDAGDAGRAPAPAHPTGGRDEDMPPPEDSAPTGDEIPF